jgi:Sec-independent protein translocase protein TatA
MAQARLNVAVLLVLAVLVPCCFFGVQELAASAQAHGGIVGGFVRDLKQEHDQAEAAEIRDMAPQTREEREEAREQAEMAAAASSPPPQEEQEEG